MLLLSFNELANVALELKKAGKILVLTTGVFDLFHRAHKEFLVNAAARGDVLLIGVESDTRVSQLKGPGRPVNPIKKRLDDVSQFDLPGYVFVLPEEFGELSVREQLIKTISPDVFAVSSHSPNLKQKQRLVEKYGGKVAVVMEKDPSISTTQVLDSH